MNNPVPYLLLLAAIACTASACKKQPPAADMTGLAVHQSVVLANPGAAGERRLEVLEDARITPKLRSWLFGGSKDPDDFLKAPGVAGDQALAAAIQQGPLKRGLIVLVDHDGKVLDSRRLDCELGKLSPGPEQQNGNPVWTLGDDCSTGNGDYAGLITYLFQLGDDRIAWQRFTAADGEAGELTLVQARRIAWKPMDQGDLTDIVEVSSHPDYDDPRFKALSQGEKPPADLPLVTDYIRYRYGNGLWTKTIRTEHAAWYAGNGFPDLDKFPG
jgi:hypothetical protein